MTKRYSVAQARAHLPEILDRVEAGGKIQLTRRGAPVAMILSTKEYAILRSGPSNFAEAYRAFIQRHPLAQIGLDAKFVASLRDRRRPRRVRL